MFFLLKLYRAFCVHFVSPFVLRRMFSSARFSAGNSCIQTVRGVVKAPKTFRYWFHAASVGELETLWSAVLEIPALIDSKVELILTVFSESAERQVASLSAELQARGVRILYAGLSPWEGQWDAALAGTQLTCFVSAKYEAWPDLWATLSLEKIPLVVVGAKKRRSLVFGKIVCGLFGVGMPRALFCTNRKEEIADLEAAFPRMSVRWAGDPRWDRVRERAVRGNVRAKELIRYCAAHPRPWGVLGSVWEGDLDRWESAISETNGLLWFVPHKVDFETVTSFERRLRSWGYKVFRSSLLASAELFMSEQEARDRHCILVDEMGFLSELYSAADWAYVGGGFGAGVHSTIEPAIQGIPVSSGHARASRFSEIDELVSEGQLTLVSSGAELGRWLKTVQSGCLDQKAEEQKGAWKAQAQKRFGASRRVAEEIVKFAGA